MSLPRSMAWLVLCVCTLAQPARGAEVEVRLIAADRGEPTPVSQLEDFRNSVDGGLIATQWVSGMMFGGKPLFPISAVGKLALDGPSVTVTEPPGTKKKKEVDDLLDDIKTTSKDGASKGVPLVKPIDVVDPLYLSLKDSSLGRTIGPQRTRKSVATVSVSASTTIQPGGVRVSPSATRIDVPCYPLTITAVELGREAFHAAFTPQLGFQGRDLLADCLFEHSPDLPLGDISGNERAIDNLQNWLEVTQGGKRLFRRLTIYLPDNSKTDSAPYELHGHELRIGANGVLIAAPKSTVRVAVKSAGKFAVELQLPAAKPDTTVAVPILVDLGLGWRCEPHATVSMSVPATSLTVTVLSPEGQATVLRPSLPVPSTELERWQLLLLVTGGRTPRDGAAARIVALPRQHNRLDNTLDFRLGSAEGGVTSATPIAVTLTPGYPTPNSEAGAPTDSPDKSVTVMTKAPGHFALKIDNTSPGLYSARLQVGEQSLPAVPLVIANQNTQGSLTLATYHNRCDFYRGEQLHVAVILRAAADNEVAIDDARVSVRHESGEEFPIASPLKLHAEAGATTSQFVTLETKRLPLGRCELRVETPKLVTYSQPFTLYSPDPKSTFALYSWASESFSAPERVAGETTTNLLLSHRPTRTLAPYEVARFTDQATFPPQLRALLAAHPLYPAPEKTATYDAETEREMAVAMRLGLRYAPDYGWGMNGQEAAWNPKHTHPDDLARMRRLCSLMAQRHRDFGNYAGLHLNWYPTLGGYWENHPATDGHAGRRAAMLRDETAALKPASGESELDLAVRQHKHRVGALPRAYSEWTERSSRLLPGMTDRPLSGDVAQPGLSPTRPVASSFLPISWFDQHAYYPSVYFSSLPAATVHAYTDYGFSPFQPLWGLDYWAAGVGKKPKWITSMSNGRDILMSQALLAAARGADGIDLKGDDEQTSRVISQFLSAYGPMFRQLTPVSDVAIITSLRQQIQHGKLVNRWMGYSGGTYFDLYAKLWYARHPAALLPEEDVTPENLSRFKAVFLVNQQTPFPDAAMRALAEYSRQSGRVFKDATTAAELPGDVYLLPKGKSVGPEWDGKKYVATRDQMFVGTQAEYEVTAGSLDQLLAQLPPQRVTSASHHTLLGTLAGQDTMVVMAVNDTRTPPGIYHPWNFWSATILAARGELSFDKPYAIYDLLDGGQLLRPEPNGAGRFKLSLAFDRCAGRALVVAPAPLSELRLAVARSTDGSQVAIKSQVITDEGKQIADPWPLEISVLNERGVAVETLHRACRSTDEVRLTLPGAAQQREWTVRVTELVSGLVATAAIELKPQPTIELTVAAVLVPRPQDVREFEKSLSSSSVILLDRPQTLLRGKSLLDLAEQFAAALRQRGRTVRVEVVDPLELVEIPQRWETSKRDEDRLAAVAAGKKIAVAASLGTRHFQGEKNRDRPDYPHPLSGYAEPAARSRIAEHVILLGDASENRFLADLRDSVGQRASDNFPAAGGALVEVTFDAFVPDRHALTIQARDLTGLQSGIDAVLKLVDVSSVKPTSNTDDAGKPAFQPTIEDTSRKRTQLARPLQESFGSPVSPIAITPQGEVLASAGLQAANYFSFAADGVLKKKWLGKYAIRPSASSHVLWTSTWWGAPGLLDKVVRCDADAQPQWIMDLPKFTRGYSQWTHPGQAMLPDRATDDLFVAGHCRVARITPDGKTAWLYDDTPTANDIPAFRFRRDLMLHDVSADGSRLLVAAFGVEPYGNIVSRFHRPSVMLFDARTGKLLWEKPDVLVHHSVCGFVGGTSGTAGATDKILVGDATDGRKRLLLLDVAGKELWSLARPQGTSAAALTNDEQAIIARPETPRDQRQQIVGEPQGMQVINVATKVTRELPLSAAVVSWRWLARSSRLLITTADGALSLRTLEGEAVWTRQFTGPASFIVPDDESQIIVGSPDGHLRWLDITGTDLRDVDLLPHNLVTDLDDYVRQYTRAPGDVPAFEPVPELPPTIEQRGRGVVMFSKNLLNARDVTALTAAPLTKSVTLLATGSPGETHILSLVQRDAPGAAAGGKIVVEVTTPGAKTAIYQTELPLSATWEERTVAWRLPTAAAPEAKEMSITLRLTNSTAELQRAGLFVARFPTSNLLAQQAPNTTNTDPLARRVDPLAVGNGRGKRLAPPDVRYFMPNDVDLSARARGAPPFKHVVEYTTPFDGRLIGQPTSWLNKPLGGSTHATLDIKLSAPAELSSLAVFEDPTSAETYTRTYALFVREAKTGRLRQVGNVVGNKNPFNLFTFPAVDVDAITYLFLDSPDKHARVMELEGYGASERLLD